MKNSWLIALRELKEKLRSRSFILMAIFGPILVLGFVYTLFQLGGSEKKHLNVLIADQNEYFEGKLMPSKDSLMSFDFINSYVDFPEFSGDADMQKYDILVEVNTKVFENKTIKIIYREKPSPKTEVKLKLYVSKRMSEIMIDEFSNLTSREFRKINQQINYKMFNAYDPKEEQSVVADYTGFFFGIIIIVFIFLFGMTILRSVSREKSNRIVEVLLATVKPQQLMVGKVVGIGLTALIQFLIWVVFIGIGLYFMQEVLYTNMFDPANLNIQQMTAEALNQSRMNEIASSREYNEIVTLVFDEIHFGNILIFFSLFFIGGYFFYGAFFSALGSSIGSESDGQQFVIPIILLLLLAVYGGYHTIYHPNSTLAEIFAFLPFTSPVVMMVKLTQGFDAGSSWQIFVSLLVLIIAAFAMFWLAGKIYKNGILQFGHRVKVKHFLKWIKKP